MNFLSIVIYVLTSILFITLFVTQNKRLKIICTTILVGVDLLFMLATLVISGYYPSILEFYLTLAMLAILSILYILYIILVIRKE